MSISEFELRFNKFLNDNITLITYKNVTGKEWIEERKSTYNFYKHKFHPDNISNLSVEDFSFFLTFRGNQSWTNLPRACKRLTNDMENLRKSIIYLQNENIPLVKRLNDLKLNGPRHMNGFGKNLLTGLLHIFNWDNYGVWNNLSEKCLKLLDCLPYISSNFGDSYLRFNNELKRLASEIDKDLVYLDGYLWWFYHDN